MAALDGEAHPPLGRLRAAPRLRIIRRSRLPGCGGAAGAIPDVEAFELLSEVSPKNGYRFGISMEFADEAAYAAYNDHPDHVRFVEQRWLAEVSEFLEIDYAAL